MNIDFHLNCKIWQAGVTLTTVIHKWQVTLSSSHFLEKISRKFHEHEIYCVSLYLWTTTSCVESLDGRRSSVSTKTTSCGIDETAASNHETTTCRQTLCAAPKNLRGWTSACDTQRKQTPAWLALFLILPLIHTLLAKCNFKFLSCSLGRS